MPEIFRGEIFRIAFTDAAKTGYILECGVGRGQSLKKLVRHSALNQLVFGFDSFEGLPEDWQMNNKFTWPKGSFACDIPEIDGAEIRKGWFVDTLPKWKKEHTGRISLLHIDSDLYSSCVTVLEELNNQIVPGTVIISDDHFYKDGRNGNNNAYDCWEQGQYKAFNEWLEKYNRKAHLLSRGKMGQGAFRIIQ